mmetsp:Transcript_17219/g.55300  ORF Transcript_17219/g.55300 Transcript_17219/m.55300 type:complete len:272 (-) Transcript_17219:247-1062(-)
MRLSRFWLLGRCTPTSRTLALPSSGAAPSRVCCSRWHEMRSWRSRPPLSLLPRRLPSPCRAHSCWWSWSSTTTARPPAVTGSFWTWPHSWVPLVAWCWRTACSWVASFQRWRIDSRAPRVGCKRRCWSGACADSRRWARRARGRTGCGARSCRQVWVRCSPTCCWCLGRCRRRWCCRSGTMHATVCQPRYALSRRRNARGRSALCARCGRGTWSRRSRRSLWPRFAGCVRRVGRRWCSRRASVWRCRPTARSRRARWTCGGSCMTVGCWRQ